MVCPGVKQIYRQANQEEQSIKKGIYLQTLLTLFFSAGLIDQTFAGTKGGFAMDLNSSAFNSGEMIPSKFTWGSSWELHVCNMYHSILIILIMSDTGICNRMTYSSAY
jgi:hypothetical protein